MRVWILVVSLFGLAALGLTMAPRAIDWDAYRSDFEIAAAKLSGHEVKIRGPIELAVFPSPTLIAKDVSVTNGDKAAIGFELAAKQADIAFAIGPLLAGQPVIQDLRLQRPVLTIDRDSSQKLRSWPPRWQEWAAPFLHLDVERLGLSDGLINLTGNVPEQDLNIRDLSLDLLINHPGGPLEAVGLFQSDHHRFAMTAEIARPDREGVSATKIVIEAQNEIAQTTSLRFSGRAIPFGDDQNLRGRLALNGPDLQSSLAALSVATGYPSTFRSIANTQPFAVEGLIEADRRGVRANDFQLRLSDKLGKGQINLQLHPITQFDLNIEAPTLHLADDAGLSEFLPLDILSKLQVPPGNINISLREMVYRDNKARKMSVKLKTGQDKATMVEEAKVLLPGLVDLRFEGSADAADIAPRLRGKLTAVGDNLKSSLAWLGLVDADDPGRGWRNFSLEGDVDITAVEMALSPFDMRLDSSRLRGKAGLRFSERRRLSLDIDFDRPNLGLYGAKNDAIRVLDGLREGLQAFDAEVDFRFKNFVWQGKRIEEGSLLVDSDEGRLTLQEISAKTVGETLLSITGVIDLQKRTADLSADLKSQYPARILHHLDLDLPLTSSRLRPLELTASMSGTLEQFALNMATAYDDGEVTIKGQAGWIDQRPWYSLTVNALHPDHRALASQFGLAPLLPEGDADGPLELAGRLRHEAKAPWIASGNAKLGPTTFTGSLAFENEPFISPFDAKVSIGSPRKDSLAPFLILAGIRLTGDWAPGRWLGRLPATGLRTAWLEKSEGTLSLVSKGGLVGEGLKINAKLNDGLLYINQIEASPWQGDLKAEFTLERRHDRPFIAIAVDLTGIEAADFTDWLGAKSGITGPLDLRLAASSAGLTPYDLMAGAAGKVELKAGPGELRGLGISELRQIMLKDVSNPGPVDHGLTMPFSEFDMKAELSRGILSFEDGLLTTPRAGGDKVEGKVEGTVDLLLWIADLTLDAAGTPPSDQQQVYRLVGPPDRPDGFISAGN